MLGILQRRRKADPESESILEKEKKNKKKKTSGKSVPMRRFGARPSLNCLERHTSDSSSEQTESETLPVARMTLQRSAGQM